MHSPVCTENFVLIDYVTESPNVSSDDRAAPLLPDSPCAGRALMYRSTSASPARWRTATLRCESFDSSGIATTPAHGKFATFSNAVSSSLSGSSSRPRDDPEEDRRERRFDLLESGGGRAQVPRARRKPRRKILQQRASDLVVFQSALG